jgi:L-alanine-DL-glutamate epimerase-like enolase superfamily enzyme
MNFKGFKMKLEWSVQELELKENFRISRDTYSIRETIIVELSEGGKTGYGEVSPNRYYGVSLEDITNTLEQHRGAVECLTFCDPKTLWYQFKRIFKENYFVISALDMAAYDLMGKIKNLSVLNSFPGSATTFSTSYTIGLANIEEMIAKVERLKWPMYKIKLGSNQDLAIIHEIRKITNSRIIVDANCAWTYVETIWKSKELKSMGVEFIEQPIPSENMDEIHALKKNSHLPIMVDESCVIQTDVAKCAALFDGINIKLAKCGGITPAFKMIREAKRLNLKIMVGCMIESSIAIAAALPLLRYADYGDLDSPMLLKKDLAIGPTFENGQIIATQKPGLGFEILIENFTSSI